jgi:hypothetical protein
MSTDRLLPTDPPVLVAGLIAAVRSGDNSLAGYYRRELRARGITIRLCRDLAQDARHDHCVDSDP